MFELFYELDFSANSFVVFEDFSFVDISILDLTHEVWSLGLPVLGPVPS